MVKSYVDYRRKVTGFQEKAEGKAEGAAEGEARGTVLTFLRARFKNVPKDIEVAVRAMTDLTALESLAVHAETCESLNEFAEVLK